MKSTSVSTSVLWLKNYCVKYTFSSSRSLSFDHDKKFNTCRSWCFDYEFINPGLADWASTQLKVLQIEQNKNDNRFFFSSRNLKYRVKLGNGGGYINLVFAVVTVYITNYIWQNLAKSKSISLWLIIYYMYM